MSLDTAICVNPENGSPFRGEPPRKGCCREYPLPPPPRVTQFKVAEHSFAGGER